MVIFNKKWKKYNEIQLTKNIMDLNIRKMTNHPPSPDNVELYIVDISLAYTVAFLHRVILEVNRLRNVEAQFIENKRRRF